MYTSCSDSQCVDNEIFYRIHERIDSNILTPDFVIFMRNWDFIYLTGDSCLIGTKTGNYYSDAGKWSGITVMDSRKVYVSFPGTMGKVYK